MAQMTYTVKLDATPELIALLERAAQSAVDRQRRLDSLVHDTAEEIYREIMTDRNGGLYPAVYIQGSGPHAVPAMWGVEEMESMLERHLRNLIARLLIEGREG
jgi:hypothetical protein